METLAERLELDQLGPEPWGAQLLRARERAGLTTREVVELLTPTWVSKTGIYNLEHRPDVPKRKLDRARALLMLVLYGTDPAAFGLCDDDAPRGVDLRIVRAVGTRYADERLKGTDPASALRFASSQYSSLDAAA